MAEGDLDEKQPQAPPAPLEEPAAGTPAPDSQPPASGTPEASPPAPASEPEPPTAPAGPGVTPWTRPPPPEAEASTPAPEAPAEPPKPVDELSDLVRVGRGGTGRRIAPLPDEALEGIRSFAAQRPIPGLGTLLDLARAHATSGRGPGLGVEAFSAIRRQLESLVADVDSIAIHVGPVLFLKTSAKNQPGTALRWLHEDERRALREHRELLDQPARLTAGLKKLLTQAREEAEDASEPDAETD